MYLKLNANQPPSNTECFDKVADAIKYVLNYDELKKKKKKISAE